MSSLKDILEGNPSLAELLTYEEFCQREGVQPGESESIDEAYHDYKRCKLGLFSNRE